MPSIKYEAKVASGATPFYGQLVVSNLHYDDDSAVTINDFFGTVFKSPARLGKNDIVVGTNPWQEVTPDVTVNQIGDSTFLVIVRLEFKGPYTFNLSDTISFGINGDLTDDPDFYQNSFSFEADQMPYATGIVEIHVPPAPTPALASSKLSIVLQSKFAKFPFNLPLVGTILENIPPGDYNVSVMDLATEDQTTVADTQASPTFLDVNIGEYTGVSITFGPVSKYSALDLGFGDIPPLQGETFHVQLLIDGAPFTDFYSSTNHTTPVRRLPETGSFAVIVDNITLNNVDYTFRVWNEGLPRKLFTIIYREDDVKSSPIDISGFVQLPIVIESDFEVDQDILIRLTSDDLIYTEKVPAQAGTTPFSVLVAPGEYSIRSASFVNSGTVYVVETATNITVLPDSSTELNLKLLKGASLQVKGFPDQLSFGAIADLTPDNAKDLVAARVSSIFKYAGTDGAGDKEKFLDNDSSTSRTIQLALEVENELADGSKVLPVMISYTCNLSQGDIYEQLRRKDWLTHSFANLILALNIAKSAVDEDHPVPAGFIVNPDFLGEGQKANLVDYGVPVREPLQDALDHWQIEAEIPDSIVDTFAGYTHAVNWLIRTVAPSVTFGWQVNIWGGGTSTWIYNTGSDDDGGSDNNEPYAEANKLAEYIKSLGTYDGEYAPDFLAIDRYEADDWTLRAYSNGYFYGPYEWRRFYDFVRDVSISLQVPVMPWQIPASRAPLVADIVSSEYDSEHWGTGGSYLLGDVDINSDYQNINPTVLSLKLDSSLIKADTAAEVWRRGEPFDLSQPAYQDFPLRGIFTVLLGGGSTTGVISTVGNAGPWVTDRLSAYADDPIKFDDTSSDGSNTKAKCRQSTGTQWWSRLWEEWRRTGNARV
ncbi:uncharacterized protein TrAtP1_007414 [Trichoderma atroviride]|uniref:uncharacterized protein n=1 Tax=Hypocrea atroviridis TaxID=63577 RepID=UPI003326DD91|nr:hypothetical protein TrAtP1_007414 [Trichoderma atroviride]